VNRDELERTVLAAVHETPVVDIHTHLYGPAFGELLRRGVDELLTYHYLVAEFLRYRPELTPAEFWALPRARQADAVWDALFVQHTPLSESARGVVTTLTALGVEPGEHDLERIRRRLGHCRVEDYIDRVFALANVRSVVMTNDPLDPREGAVWQAGTLRDARFRPALRLDGVLLDWPAGARALSAQGFPASEPFGANGQVAVRDFLGHWIGLMQPVYLAVSLPPTFNPHDGSPTARLLCETVVPVALEHGLPLALMIGVRKGVNPALGDAGDGVGRADVAAVEELARAFPRLRLLVTMLSRENQHELCVAARKFSNLLVFGCWWFLNSPSIIRELTAERLEWLGLTFIPQHSDARVLDQLIYKWAHSRAVIGAVLAEKYQDVAHAGWPVTAADIRRDVARLMGGELLTGPSRAS